jgi:hypothetical protein
MLFGKYIAGLVILSVFTSAFPPGTLLRKAVTATAMDH